MSAAGVRRQMVERQLSEQPLSDNRVLQPLPEMPNNYGEPTAFVVIRRTGLPLAAPNWFAKIGSEHRPAPVAFLLRRRLALAFTAVPHRLFNHRCAKGRRVDFEQRIFRPLKDLPIEFIGSLHSRSGRSG